MLNEKICISGGANTGFGDCTLDIKTVVGAFLVPPGTEVEPADLVDFGAFLETKVNHDDPAVRWYPIHGFEEITDNSEEVQVNTFGYGGKAVSREGDYDWTLRFMKGALCLLKALRMFNQTGKDVFFYDADGILFGSKSGDNLRSIPLTLYYANPWAANDGSTPANYSVRLSFKPSHVNENIGYIDTRAQDLVMSTFQGLKNLILSVVDPENAPVTDIKALAGCDRKNLYDEFETELADETLWEAETVEGVALTVSTVVAKAANKSFTVTVTDGATDTFGDYYVKLVGPTALAAAGVTGYESKRVRIPKA